MDIRLQSLHFKASDNLKNFVNEKVGKLFDHNNKITYADITLFEQTGGAPDSQYCEIRLAVPDNDLFVKKNSPSYEQSIAEAVDAMQEIMRRHHTKVANQRSDPA